MSTLQILRLLAFGFHLLAVLMGVSLVLALAAVAVVALVVLLVF